MFEQSARQRVLSGAFLACMALILPGPAPAQRPMVAVPADAPTALSAPDGSALIVFVTGSRLCFAVQASGSPRPSEVSRVNVVSGGEGTVGGCRTLPVFAPPAGEELVEFSTANASGSFMVTGTAVAAVQAKRNGKVLAHTDTIASPLPGAAAELRFAFLQAPESPAMDETAFLDASGAVRRADSPLFSDETPVLQTLRRGGKGGRAWRLSSYRQEVLSPTPLLPERKVTVTCLSVNIGDASDSVCDDEQLAAVPALPIIAQSCSPLGITVAVLARSEVHRVTLVLGDGSRRAVALRAVPGAPDGQAAGITFVRPSMAIRRMVITSAGGRVLSSNDLQLAPASASTSDCDRHLSFAYSFADDTLKTPGPHVFHATDRGVQLCVAPDRAPDASEDCAIPPVDARDSRLLVVGRKDATTVAGVVPAEVAIVRLTLDDGSRRDIAATPIPGYAGQYLSTNLMINAEIPAPRRVGGYALLDRRGRVVEDRGESDIPALHRRSTVLRTPGLPPLRAALVTGFDETALPCLGLGALSKVSECVAGDGRNFIARAFCTPRRIVIWGLLAHADDNLVVQTTDGREITARKAVLPAAIRRGKGTTAALVVLPARVGARRLLLRGRAAGKTDLVVPRAAEQCGYENSARIQDGLLRD